MDKNIPRLTARDYTNRPSVLMNALRDSACLRGVGYSAKGWGELVEDNATCKNDSRPPVK